MASLTIRNTDETPKTLQIEARSWRQSEGKDVYEKTDDIIITPIMFTIEGETSQLVRVAQREESDGSEEQTYRLFIREVYQKKPQTQGVNILFDINMPFFIMPTEAQLMPYECKYRLANAQNIALTCTNNDNIHQFINKIIVQYNDGKTQEIDTFQYILAGHSATIKKQGNFNNLDKVQISLRANNEVKIVDVPQHR